MPFDLISSTPVAVSASSTGSIVSVKNAFVGFDY